MVIVVNTRLLVHDRLDGIGRFTCETLQRITQSQPDLEFVFLFDREIHEDFIFSNNITPVKLFPPARRPWLFNAWLNWSVAGVLRDLKPDLFLSPDGYLPLKGITPCLPVIHDLNFEHYPEDVPANIARWYKKKFPLFAQRATRIATVSEYSKNDIVQHYNIDASKIDVVYNGAAQGFHPLEAEQIVAVRKKITGGAPYFLYIGALHPRKNLERLVRAYGEFRRKNDSQTKLVIAGGNYWNYEALQKAIETVPDKNEIIFTGRLSEEELFQVTGAALALTYVPYFEGFGIPIVEAMACDIPVLTSNITAMPEVGGDAALYVDPFSEESISSALAMMDKDESLRGNLIAKAKIQREKFSWDKTAAALWNSMEKTIGESKK
ncbi:MAG: glycosyltransferase family 1 protein [Bacteroidetes bacterium]|nr:glycosyltransferase family 1 protein [Bacteroidota bacterium]